MSIDKFDFTSDDKTDWNSKTQAEKRKIVRQAWTHLDNQSDSEIDRIVSTLNWDSVCAHKKQRLRDEMRV